MVEIAYGVHPLFVNPFYSRDVYLSIRTDDERFYTVNIREAGPVHHFEPYSNDALVYAPKADGRGYYTLDQVILPRINSVRSVEQCYHFHSKKSAERSGRLTQIMVDEAIYLNDTCAYPNCKLSLEKLIAVYQKYCELYPARNTYKDTLEQLKMQRQVLSDGTREEYLLFLKQRIKKTTKLLSEKFGIVVYSK